MATPCVNPFRTPCGAVVWRGATLVSFAGKGENEEVTSLTAWRQRRNARSDPPEAAGSPPDDGRVRGGAADRPHTKRGSSNEACPQLWNDERVRCRAATGRGSHHQARFGPRRAASFRYALKVPTRPTAVVLLSIVVHAAGCNNRSEPDGETPQDASPGDGDAASDPREPPGQGDWMPDPDAACCPAIGAEAEGCPCSTSIQSMPCPDLGRVCHFSGSRTCQGILNCACRPVDGGPNRWRCQVLLI